MRYYHLTKQKFIETNCDICKEKFKINTSVINYSLRICSKCKENNKCYVKGNRIHTDKNDNIILKDLVKKDLKLE